MAVVMQIMDALGVGPASNDERDYLERANYGLNGVDATVANSVDVVVKTIITANRAKGIKSYAKGHWSVVG